VAIGGGSLPSQPSLFLLLSFTAFIISALANAEWLKKRHNALAMMIRLGPAVLATFAFVSVLRILLAQNGEYSLLMAQLPEGSGFGERLAASWSIPGSASLLLLAIASWWWVIEDLDGEGRSPLLAGGQRWCHPAAWFAAILILGPGDSLARGEVLDRIIGLEAEGRWTQIGYGIPNLVLVIIAGLGLGHLPRVLRDACFEPFIPENMNSDRLLMVISSISLITILIMLLLVDDSIARGSQIFFVTLATISLIAGLMWPRRTVNDTSVLWVIAAGMLASSIATAAVAPESSVRELLSLDDDLLRSRFVTALALHSVQPILLGGLFLSLWATASRLVWRLEPEHIPFHAPEGKRHRSQAAMSATTAVIFVFTSAAMIHGLQLAENGPEILLKTVTWTLPPLLLASFGLLLPELGADARSRPEAWGWRCAMWVGLVGVMAWEPSTVLLAPCFLIAGMGGYAVSRLIEESGIHGSGHSENIVVGTALVALILGTLSVGGMGWDLIPWLLMTACWTLGTITRLPLRPLEIATRRGVILLPFILFGLGAGGWVWFPILPLLIYSRPSFAEDE